MAAVSESFHPSSRVVHVSVSRPPADMVGEPLALGPLGPVPVDLPEFTELASRATVARAFALMIHQ